MILLILRTKCIYLCFLMPKLANICYIWGQNELKIPVRPHHLRILYQYENRRRVPLQDKLARICLDLKLTGPFKI